jgi:N-acetylneuraminic acid mutarotase
MRSRSNLSGTVPTWITTVLAALGGAACGGEVNEAEAAAAAASAPPAATGEPATSEPARGDLADPTNEPSDAPPDDVPESSPADLSEPLDGSDDPVECPWLSRATMPLARSGMASAEHGGFFYLFGGQIQDAYTAVPDAPVEGRYSVVQAYDPATDTWTRKQRMPVDVMDLTANTVDEAIYVFTGYGTQDFSNLVYRYEPATDGWLEVSAVPLPHAEFMSETVAGKIYLIGGSGVATDGTWSSQDDLLTYDPATNTWSEGTSAPGGIEGGASCVLGDRIFAFDGVASGATYIYDTTTSTWSEGAPAPQPRTWMRCVPWDGKLLLLGGRRPLLRETDPIPDGPFDFNGVTIESSDLIQEYDPATDSWREFGRMPRARELFVAMAFERDLFVIGGSESHTQEGPYGTFLLDEIVALSSDVTCP